MKVKGLGGSLSQWADHTRHRLYLERLEKQLRRADTSHLSFARRYAREMNLDRLQAYGKAGIFPRNTDYPGKRLPCFIDKYGTRCAVAHLMEKSGYPDLVKKMARTNSHMRVKDIKDGPALDWIKRSGLTQEELARMQCPGGAEIMAGYTPLIHDTLAIGGYFLVMLLTCLQGAFHLAHKRPARNFHV